MTTQTYSMTVGGAVRRIRSPHPNDVLSGRGGGINAHEGNKRFREQVALRKEDYNLAPNKAEKTRIATEVMEKILHQDPPGRFLQRDESVPSGPTWWVEVSEAKALAKTSQALREGAPQIRLAHQDELHQRAEQSKNTPKRKTKQSIAKPAEKKQVTSDPGLGKNTSFAIARSSARKDGSAGPALKVVSKRLPDDQYKRALEKLQQNAREAQSLSHEEAEGQQHQHQQHRVGSIGTIAPLTSNKDFAERYWSPPKRPRSDPDPTYAPTSPTGGGVRMIYPNGNADADAVDVMAETPPLIPAPAPISDTGMVPLDLGSSRNVLKSYASSGLKNGRGLTRTHSLAFSDISTSDLYMEEDEFVNPFADESDVANKVLQDDNRAGQSTAAPDTPGTMFRNLSSSESVSGNISDIQMPLEGAGLNWTNATSSR
jgi:hypothetical protein